MTQEPRHDSLLLKLTRQVPGVIYQFQQMPDGTYRMPFANNRLKEIIGVNPEDVAMDAGPIFEKIHPEDREPLFCSIEQSYQQKTDWENEFRVINPDNEICWLRGLARIELLHNGGALWHGYLQDVTQRKLTEQQTKEAQQKYQGYFESAPDGLFVVDSEGRFLEANPAACRMTGYSHEQLLCMSVKDLVHPCFHPAKNNTLIRSFKIGALDEEIKLTKAGGEEIWIRLVTSRLNAQAVIAFCHDITSRKEDEERLASQLSFEILLSATSSRFVNTTLEEFDASVDEVLNNIGEYFKAHRSYVFVFSEDYSSMSNTHEWCARGVEPQKEQLQNFPVGKLPWWWKQMKDKKCIHIPDLDKQKGFSAFEREQLEMQGIKSLLCIPMLDRGILIGFFGLDRIYKSAPWSQLEINHFYLVSEVLSGVFGKIRAWKALSKLNEELLEKQNALEQLNVRQKSRIEEEVSKNRRMDQLIALQARQAALGEMIGNIAHQWRQPLNLLSLAVYDLEEAYRNNELNTEYLENSMQYIDRVVQDMSATIDQFRSNFKPTGEKRTFNVSEVMDDAIAFLKPYCVNMKIKVNRVVEDDFDLTGYAEQMEQVFINILKNAYDALCEHKPIEKNIDIKICKLPQSRGRVEIRNSGKPIHEEMLPRLFDPYFTTKQEGEGKGLGLYLAKVIVEKHMKGSLYCNNLDDGVAFVIEF